MRIAILSSFPPEVCGIGEYAAQQAIRLERDGHTVDRIPLDPLRWGGWTKAAVADVESRLRRADRAIVHYQVGLFLDKTRNPRILRFIGPHRALRKLARRVPHLEVVVHESSWLVYRGPGQTLQWPIVRAFLAAAPKLVFHTATERAVFERTFRLKRPSTIVAHQTDFIRQTDRSKVDARRRLGVASADRLILCIGFYAKAKGFEDALDRFAALAKAGRLQANARLHIVTSVREPDATSMQAELAALVARAASAPQVTVDARYVSGEEFDDWLVAADALLLPYRSSYSSGVAARAALYETPIIASAVGGLGEQIGPAGRIYQTPQELDAILLEFAGASNAKA